MQEGHLQFPASEFPQIDDCKAQIQPYAELWSLQKDYM